MIPWRICMAGLAALSLFACRQPSPDDAAAPAATQDASRLPVVVPPLDREGLLLAGIHAASAAYAGRDDTEAQRALGNRRFDLRLRFGCPGDRADANAGLQFTFDETRRVIRFSVKPDIAADSRVIKAMGFEDMEGAKGFWIKRPWLLSAACPAAAPASAAPPLSGPPSGVPASPASPVDEDEPAVLPVALSHIGIAQVFTASDSRTHLNYDRTYEATVPLGDTIQPSGAGYDVLLSGRLQRMASGKVIACHHEGPDAPPACLISVLLDQITLTRADTGAILAQWAGA